MSSEHDLARGRAGTAARVIAAAALLIALAAGIPPSVPAQAVVPEPAGAVGSVARGLSATAASHPKKPPKKRRQTQIGDAACSGDPVDRPTIEFDVSSPSFPAGSFQLGVPFHLCIKGFAETEPIDVVVTLPNGAQRRNRIRPDPSYLVPTWYFVTYPPDPLGSYHVAATQGARAASGTFTIKPPPSRPSLETLLFSVRAGRAIPFVLAGFGPGEKVALYLYRQVGYDRRTDAIIYRRERRSVASIRTDPRGFALGQVKVRRPGEYYLSAGRVFATYSVRVRRR